MRSCLGSEEGGRLSLGSGCSDVKGSHKGKSIGEEVSGQSYSTAAAAGEGRSRKEMGIESGGHGCRGPDPLPHLSGGPLAPSFHSWWRRAAAGARNAHWCPPGQG